MKFVAENSHGLGQIEGGEIYRWDGGDLVAVAEFLVSQAPVFRAEKEGDLFRDVLVKKQKLPYL